MLSLDQVRLLENRVEKAVGKIRLLETENDKLRGQITAFQARIGELEGLVHAFKDDQGRIEEGILNALDRLSAFEDSVFSESEAEPEGSAPISESETIADPERAEETRVISDAQDQDSGDQPGFDLDETESTGQMDIF